MSHHQTFTQAVYDYLTARPNQWVDSSVLEKVGGRMAWRTRTSEVRQRLKAEGKGTVENQQRRVRRVVVINGEEHKAGNYIASLYRYVPEPVTVRVEDNGQQVFL